MKKDDKKMRIKLKISDAPQNGDIRICHGFLFLPKVINNELRWLETAWWEERFHSMLGEDSETNGYWDATKWLGPFAVTLRKEVDKLNNV